MTAPLPHYLVLLRNAVDRLRNLDDAAARNALLDQMRRILGRMMVDAGPGPGLADDAAATLAALAGDAAPGDLASAADTVATRLEVADLAHDPAAVSLARAALAADQAYVRGYEDAVLAAVAAPPFARATHVASAAEIAALQDFIRRTIDGEAGVEIAEVRLASVGYSKKTLLVTLAGNRVLPDEIVIRLDQAFNFLGTTVLDEYPVVEFLHAQGVPVPRPYALEARGDVLGFPFILSARVRGDVLGTSYFPPARNDRLTASIAACLAAIHATPIDRLVETGMQGAAGASFIEREVEKHHRDWKALEGYASSTIDAAFAWVRANLDKAHGRRTIVHNDYNYHNLLVQDDTVTAVLDWEFVHIGNPAADLGYFHDVAERCGGFDLFLRDYAAAGGILPSQDELDFYILWAHVRFGIMCFQSEAGLNTGKFDDIRNAMSGVDYLRKPSLCIGERLDALLARMA